MDSAETSGVCLTSCAEAEAEAEADVVLQKKDLVKLALNSTSCAGCVASIKGLLERPLSDIRMVKAIAIEHGEAAFRLKEAYVKDQQRTRQLLSAFPMSSVLKKVQPSGSSQRCQIHRRLPANTAGTGASFKNLHLDSWSNGNAMNPSRGGWNSDIIDWEDAWYRMSSEMRAEVATITSSSLEAAMHQATEATRFCPDCKHNVVQALDILLGKCSVEGSENEEEFAEDVFGPLKDRVFEGDDDSGRVLVCDTHDVEELIWWHEDFISSEVNASFPGKERHAATLEHGQREIRSVVGAVLLSQLRSMWLAQSAQVQAEQYLFCLVVDTIRTKLASKRSVDHDHRCSAGIDGSSTPSVGDRDRNGCVGDRHVAGDGDTDESSMRQRRREKRRQKKKAKKRVKRELLSEDGPSLAAQASEGGTTCRNDGTETTEVHLRDSEDNDCARSCVASDTCEASASSDDSYENPSSIVDDVFETKSEEGQEEPLRSQKGVRWIGGVESKCLFGGGFGKGGLACQLDDAGSDESDDEVDSELILEMEQLKSTSFFRTDRDRLRKVLQQNYNRFVSQRTLASNQANHHRRN